MGIIDTQTSLIDSVIHDLSCTDMRAGDRSSETSNSPLFPTSTWGQYDLLFLVQKNFEITFNTCCKQVSCVPFL